MCCRGLVYGYAQDPGLDSDGQHPTLEPPPPPPPPTPPPPPLPPPPTLAPPCDDDLLELLLE